LENNGEKKNGCWKKNGLENNGEKNRGCESKDVLEKSGENRNGREEKKRLDRNGENDREERSIFGRGATNCGMLPKWLFPKWLFPSTAADLKGGRGTSGLILRDRKGGRGTIEVVPAIREGGGRGTNRSVRFVVGWIARAEAIGGDDSMARSSANGDGASETELNCRAAFDSENRCGPLVNELCGASLSARELNSDHPRKLGMGRIGWKARNPYGG